MNLDRWLTIVTGAGLVGLVVLNWQGANALLKTIADSTVQYVRTVQGR